MVLFVIDSDKCANKHNDRKYDQIPDVCHLVLEDTRRNDDTDTDKRKYGKHEALEGMDVLFIFHHNEKDRNIHRVDSNDRKLGGVERILADSAKVKESGTEENEVYEPNSAGKKSERRRVVGHIRLFIDLVEGIG